MYCYKVFYAERVLITRFSGEYFEDEIDTSILAIVNSMTIDQRYSIDTVIWDLQNVTAMSLVNTDYARVIHFDREMFKLFDHPERDAVQRLSEVKLHYIKPEDSAVQEVFRERIERVARPGRITPKLDIGDPRTISELLDSLNLTKLLPLLNDGWQGRI